MSKFKLQDFVYFKNLVGRHIYVYLFLNFMVGLLDGLGLAMFVPLLSLSTGSIDSNESLGNLEFLVIFFEKNNIDLTLQIALLMMVIIFIFKGILLYIKTVYFTYIRVVGLKTIRLKLIDKLSKVSYEGFTKIDVGKIQSNMVGETAKALNALIAYFNYMQNGVMLLTYVALAFFSNWRFALMVGIGAMLTNFIYTYMNRITKENARNISKIGYDFNGNLIQALHNFKYLKATNYFRIFESKMRANIEKSEEISMKLGKIGAIAESLREPMIIIIIAGVILIQVTLIGNDFSTILLSLLLFYRCLGHLVTMQNTWNGYVASSAGIESVENLMTEFENEKEVVNEVKVKNISDIHLSNIRLQIGNKQILNNINLKIKDKTSIALVGESGAGKTTLANVICGLQRPTEGTIETAGHEIYKTNLNKYRNRIGYITQEAVIFNDTVFNNISFWSEKNQENLDKFHRVLKMVSLEQFVDALDEKEDSKLGHNGILISGGQKQRISIARELYKDIDLLLMDEATSALDSETEKYIKDNIDILHGKFTMVIIAHRLSTIKKVDQIYIIENGEIADSGTYEELVGKSLKFKRMVELQELL